MKEVDQTEVTNSGAVNQAQDVKGYNPATGLIPPMNEAAQEEWRRFWGSQPVASQEQLESLSNAAAHTIKEQTVADIPTTPAKLPVGYAWDTIDLNDEEELTKLFNLLKSNYVEDEDARFRFEYSKEFLRWCLSVPGMNRDWHLVVRNEKTGGLLAFLSAVPVTMKVHSVDLPCVEVNFLCVHKALRSKRLAPVIIGEITRRVRLTGVFHAVFSAGIKLPGSFAKCTYFHRSIKVEKLIDIGFLQKPHNISINKFLKNMRCPQSTIGAGIWRRAKLGDAEIIRELLNKKYARKGVGAVWKGNSYDEEGNLIRKNMDSSLEEPTGRMQYHPVYSLEEITHYLISPDESVVQCYVHEVNDAITDFVSFYRLPTQVLQQQKGHTHLYASYMYYSAGSLSQEELMRNTLYFANETGHDVLNGLVMNNQTVHLLKELGFGQGDGNLHHYCFNWAGPQMECSDVGLILC